MDIEKLNVLIRFEDEKLKVGQLVKSDKEIYFRYNAEFIESGLEISPFKLPLNTNIVSAKQQPFDGLFGVFSDSLPDTWGRLLLDRKLATQGIPIQNIHPLQRLAYTGSSGMGALIYEPEFENKDTNELIDLDKVSAEAEQIFQGESSQIIDELYKLGGSSGGARPKILIAYNSENGQMLSSHDQNPVGLDPWIVKFPASIDMVDIANIEYAYYKMARTAGINMSESQLIKGNSGKVYFASKRFDRIHNKRLHMHSAAGLMHDDYRYSTMDYGHLMDAAFQLERHVNAYERIFRLATFNVFAHNRDDHSKNFSFLMNSKGIWQFAPAYDLTFSESAHGHHNTMIAGESKNPGTKHLLELAKHFGLKNANIIIDEIKTVLSQWPIIAEDYGISKNSKQKIQKVIMNQLKL